MLDPLDLAGRGDRGRDRAPAGRRRRAASSSTPCGPRIERDPEQRRADLGDVGQQRGRHAPADRRGGRARGAARHPRAHRRDPGRGRRAGRLLRERRRPDDADRAQDRRPVRGRAPSLVRRELEVTAMLHGGGQERDIRSGTLDPPAIAGFAAAVEAAVKAQPEHAERMAALRDRLVEEVQRVVPDADRQRAPDRTAARQRPPALPRLRRRLAADAARRPRHRVLDRARPARPAWPSPPTC